ncbi:hypothetical protein SAMN06297251_1418 [Fulvimarina manganoxydans]|uniref:Uncharacterized protein n=1 Tax=Fulvimarina manganoxydans TaxID=937218 RepID=A0A1W2EXA9_9HYPH|nr:hypothetical protein SAMN06297251_1418 [Fulvimarina manganoxydans]
MAILYLGPFGKGQSIFDIDAKIANGALDLRMTEKDLNRSQVAGRLLDNRRLRPAERMRSVVLSPETDRSHPLVDQTGVLPGA